MFLETTYNSTTTEVDNVLVENFNGDRDEYDEFMEGRGFGEGAAKTFLPEHWRDAYRAASKQDWGEFSDDEKLKWTQIPAYLVEYYALKKGGKALWRKLSGYGKSTKKSTKHTILTKKLNSLKNLKSFITSNEIDNISLVKKILEICSSPFSPLKVQ